MSAISQRLFIVTGKGGVGKTTFSLSLAHYLKKNNRNVFHYTFGESKPNSFLKELGIPALSLNTKESCEIYMARKIKSKTAAKWINKTPFFSAMFNMLPGFENLILVGHIIDLIESDPSIYIVVDSPASGHALAMLESSVNFKSIFGDSLLSKDILRMHKVLHSEKITQTYVLALAGLMPIQEALDLSEQVKKLNFKNAQLVLNNVISDNPENLEDRLPQFLEGQIKLQKEFGDKFDIKIPYSLKEDENEVIKEVSSYIEELL